MVAVIGNFLLRGPPLSYVGHQQDRADDVRAIAQGKTMQVHIARFGLPGRKEWLIEQRGRSALKGLVDRPGDPVDLEKAGNIAERPADCCGGRQVKQTSSSVIPDGA